ncbi:hypothetical protein KSP39_PZI022009 [Platanthera zijinensis]|uniref:Uncharacterized protein n=1 Tax=Platanthera zijinensis TaxID=2320716 RepID=A0AAP0AWX2_9ASPA
MDIVSYFLSRGCSMVNFWLNRRKRSSSFLQVPFSMDLTVGYSSNRLPMLALDAPLLTTCSPARFAPSCQMGFNISRKSKRFPPALEALLRNEILVSLYYQNRQPSCTPFLILPADDLERATGTSITVTQTPDTWKEVETARCFNVREHSKRVRKMRMNASSSSLRSERWFLLQLWPWRDRHILPIPGLNRGGD